MNEPRAKTGDELTHLAERLESCRERVPDSALRFHASVEELRARVETARHRLWPWRRRRELAGLENEIANLTAAAPHLEELFAGVSRVLTKIRRLEHRVTGGEQQIVDWISNRCTDWESALEQLHHTVPRAPEVARAKQSLEGIELAIDLHDDAIEWIRRAGEALRSLSEHGLELEGAELSADLPDILERLRLEGPTRSSIDDLSDRVRPLERLLGDQPQIPPEEYGNAKKSMDIIERWARNLRDLDQWPEEHADAFGDLEHRLRRFGQAWKQRDPAEAETLHGETDEFLKRLVQHAGAIRAEALDDLIGQVRHLTQICGPVPGFQEQIGALRERSVASPDAHRSWWKALDTTRQRFRSEADNHREQLELRLGERGESLHRSLEDLTSIPSNRETRARLLELREKVGSLGRRRAAEDILHDLHQADRREEAIEDLRQRMAEARGALDERIEAIGSRNRSLRRLARGVGVSARDLHKRIRELEDRDKPRALEDETVTLEELEAEMSAACRSFVSACRETVEELLREASEIREVLGPEAPPPPDPVSEADSGDEDVEGAAAQVSAIREQVERLRKNSRQTLERLRDRRRDILGKLGDLDLEALRPGDRETAEDLSRTLDRATPSDDPAPVRDIARLAPPVRDAEALLARLAGQEQEARNRLELLIQRVERFRAEGLHRWSPVLADRVEGLIRGVPDHPRRWQAVLEQLDRAESLLDRLELHGRRLLAAELDRSVEALEERHHRHGDPKAESLLRELVAGDAQQVPPVSLRQRVREHLANPTRFAERRNRD